MVFILQRYIFRELIKVFVLATIALTLIMSLGSILGSIQEYGIGPIQVLRLMSYSLPVMFTFVLPMSALFAVALVYGRFASDNELDACRASGISLVALIYPGLVLAIVVAIVNLVLSFHVVPAFVHKAEKALKADAKQILFRNIQRKGFYKLPPDKRYKIYADEVNPQNDTLYGIVVLEEGKDGIEKIIETEAAKIIFDSHDRFSEIQIIAKNIYQIENEGWAYLGRVPVKRIIPSMLGDDIRYKKISEMKKIQADPLLFYPIEESARKTYAQFTADLLAQDISEKMASDTNEPYELFGEPNMVQLRATSCAANDKQQVELFGNVEIVQFDSDTRQPLRHLQCTRLLISIEGDEFAPTLKLELTSPRWRKIDGSEGLAAGKQFIRGLILPALISDEFEPANILKTINPVHTSSVLVNGTAGELKKLQTSLDGIIQKTLTDIKAEINTRLVFGIGCVLLIMIGIGLGIMFKGGHLLTAFGASCIPGSLLIVCILMGKNVAKNPGSGVNTGISLMWSGLVILIILAAFIYRKLLKN